METYKLYGGEIELNFDPDRHLYTVGDKIVYGVTSITGILDKPALVSWATNLAVNKVLEMRANLAENLEDVLTEAKNEHYRISKEARELGTRVHAVADRWFSEDKLGLVEEMLKAKTEAERNALSAFIAFIKSNKVERDWGERKIYSKKYEYAGTADFIGKLNGIPTVADYKTSAAIYPEYFVQVAAYAQALEEEGIKTKQTAVVRVGKDRRLEIQTDGKWREKIPVFLSLKKVYEWLMSLNATEIDKDIQPTKIIKK